MRTWALSGECGSNTRSTREGAWLSGENEAVVEEVLRSSETDVPAKGNCRNAFKRVDGRRIRVKYRWRVDTVVIITVAVEQSP